MSECNKSTVDQPSIEEGFDMEAISASNAIMPATSRPASAFSDLGSQDFLRLMLTELTNQDPLAPTDNEALLRQISSIRDIEMSTSLTESLQRLTGHQQIGSSSVLIGQFVTGLPSPDGSTPRGLVVGVRFAEGGRALLMLSGGAELPLEQVAKVESAQQAAEGLVGATVVGLDRRASEPKVVEDVVSGLRAGDKGEMLLELESGADLRLQDVLGVVLDDEV
jgi:flagellar basal-body rod modification protein FlgD